MGASELWERQRARAGRDTSGSPALLLLDVAAVLAFVVLGRRTHTEAETLKGIAETAAPFLLAMGVGWIMTQAWTRPKDSASGVVVWLLTIVIGMVLRRLLFHDGTAVPFVIVATCFLGACLLGWRFATWRLARRA